MPTPQVSSIGRRIALLQLDPSFAVGTRFWKGLVPDAALDIPYEEDLPNVWKDMAAMLEDKGLKRVAKAQAVVERLMGRRLARLRDTGGLIKLGFVRLGDYARERLEIGCRSAQEMARVGAALETLPALRKASDEGRLTLSQVRLLVGIVTPETEAEWIERASTLAVRGLREEIKLRKQEVAGSVQESDPDTEEDTAELSFQAPSWFKAKWDTAVDFYRKVEGRADLPAGAAAEAFAAEWHSGAGLSAPAQEDTHTPASPKQNSPECSNVGVPKTTGRPSSRSRNEKGIEEEYHRWAFLNENDPTSVRLPAWLDAFDCRLTDDPFELDDDLVYLERARRELDTMNGRMLCTMGRVRVFHMMQFLDLGHYSRERMGMGQSTARRLRWIERYMYDLPEVREAYYKGEIGIAKVTQLVRVRGARNIGDWVKRAKRVTVRRLEQEVQLVLRRAALVESRLLSLPQGEDPYELFPEGADLVRSASALDEIARKGPNQAATPSGPTVTIRCAMETEALAVWQECVDHCRALYGRDFAEWKCANLFIDAFFEAYDKKDPRRYALNHKVFERDGWQCTCPGCSSRGHLENHHPKRRSQRGPNTMENGTTACRLHHGPAIHGGTVEVDGTAPDGLIWRLGVRKNGKALLTVGPGEQILQPGEPPRQASDACRGGYTRSIFQYAGILST
jgi:hypothetical protein